MDEICRINHGLDFFSRTDLADVELPESKLMDSAYFSDVSPITQDFNRWRPHQRHSIARPVLRSQEFAGQDVI
jgi:hypothetical protein